ncbi:MAG: FAD:protein FMN transferase [Clostridiales bacterium]|nr:FAD:protein FMN transferase [Clostridiales bacterium]
MKRSAAVGLACLLLLVMTGCTMHKEPVRREIFSMDTHITITCYGKEAEEAADAAAKEIERLNQLWSIGEERSEVCRINKEGGGDVSPETAELLELALRLYAETDRALDVTVLPLMELWGFTSRDPAVPEASAVEKTLQSVDAGRVRLDGQNVQLDEGQGIDLGALAKGYASARAAAVLEAYDIEGAVLSLGGNIQCVGQKPAGKGGTLWRIGIRHPDDAATYLGVLTLTDKAVITSGGYERFFEENGQIYHHILDPSNGYPAKSGLASVTIVSADGALADGLSTACFVMGAERSIEYWKAHAEAFDMILMTDDGKLWITEPLQQIFETEMAVEVIRK